MNNPQGWRFTCCIRAKGQTDVQWRDVSAISAWTTGEMDFGIECARNESLRRFVSAAARAARVVEVKVVTRQKERIREMRVGRYKNLGANRAPDGYMRFEFRPTTPPKSSRLVAVQMITD